MRRSSLVWNAVAILISFGASVNAIPDPSNTWAPAPTCSNGLSPSPVTLQGTYLDQFGANWNVECAQDSDGFVYESNSGTNGQGIYACFQGCDKRPGCTAFQYTGTVTGNPGGAGRCYYKMVSGNYFSNSGSYAAANLISNGTPQMPVCLPYLCLANSQLTRACIVSLLQSNNVYGHQRNFISGLLWL